MWTRALFVGITFFFLVMNILLFRSEFGGRNEVRSTIPADLVFRKILTSPDRSFLEIRHHGHKIGRCQLSPSIGQEVATGTVSTEDLPPEGMIEEMSSYSLDANGDLTLDEATRLRFNFDVKVSTNLAWLEFVFRVTMRPLALELRATANQQKVDFRLDDGTSRTVRSYTFDDLRRPEKLLTDLGGPLLPATLGTLGIPLTATTNLPIASVPLKWDAREDKLKIGGSFMRVYRLQVRVLDRLPVVIYVSRVGEILRVDLPDEIVLANDVLMNL